MAHTLQASAVLVASLQRCLAADVFLRPLADRFARLALQLVARYAGWLGSGARQSTDGSADADKVSAGLNRLSCNRICSCWSVNPNPDGAASHMYLQHCVAPLSCAANVRCLVGVSNSGAARLGSSRRRLACSLAQQHFCTAAISCPLLSAKPGEFAAVHILSFPVAAMLPLPG